MNIQKIRSTLKAVFEQIKHECPVFGVLVVGETGTGKSTLINNLIGEDIASEGDSLQSETARISKHKMDVEGVPVAFYDTPGLGDSRFTSDEDHLKKMRRILKTGEIQLVIYCFKLTETRMRQSLIRTLKEYNKIGMKWDQTVIALTFADCVKPPVKETKKQGFDMVRYFDDRVTMVHAEITKTLVEIVGVTQKDAGHILCKPTTSDPDELLLNGKKWFVPLWIDILQLLSPPAALRFFEMNASKVEQHPMNDTDDSTKLPKSMPHSSMRRDVHTSCGNPNTATSQSFPNRVVSAPSPTDQRPLCSALHGHHTYHISQTVHLQSANPSASPAHTSNHVRKIWLEPKDEKRMGEILIAKVATYTSKGAIIGGIAGAVVGLVGGPLGVVVGGTIGGAIGGFVGFFKSLIS